MVLLHHKTAVIQAAIQSATAVQQINETILRHDHPAIFLAANGMKVNGSCSVRLAYANSAFERKLCDCRIVPTIYQLSGFYPLMVGPTECAAVTGVG